MLAELSTFQKSWVEKTAKGMSDEEKVAQVMSWSAGHLSDDQIVQILDQIPFGSIFVNYNTVERCRQIGELLAGRAGIPVIVCADLENGLGSRIDGGTIFPWLLGCGDSDSEELMEETVKAFKDAGVDAKIMIGGAPVTQDYATKIGAAGYAADAASAVDVAKDLI